MESTNAHGDAKLAKVARKVDRTRKLVGLNAGKSHERLIARLEGFRDPGGLNAPVRLVESGDDHIHVRPEHLPLAAILGETVEAGQCVRGDRRPQPLDGIPIVIIVRGLDQNEMEFRHRSPH